MHMCKRQDYVPHTHRPTGGELLVTDQGQRQLCRREGQACGPEHVSLSRLCLQSVCTATLSSEGTASGRSVLTSSSQSLAKTQKVAVIFPVLEMKRWRSTASHVTSAG